MKKAKIFIRLSPRNRNGHFVMEHAVQVKNDKNQKRSKVKQNKMRNDNTLASMRLSSAHQNEIWQKKRIKNCVQMALNDLSNLRKTTQFSWTTNHIQFPSLIFRSLDTWQFSFCSSLLLLIFFVIHSLSFRCIVYSFFEATIFLLVTQKMSFNILCTQFMLHNFRNSFEVFIESFWRNLTT